MKNLEAKNITTNIEEAETVEQVIDLLLKTDDKNRARVIAEYCELAQLKNVIVNDLCNEDERGILFVYPDGCTLDLIDECDEEEIYSSDAFMGHFDFLRRKSVERRELCWQTRDTIFFRCNEAFQIFQKNMKDNFDIVVRTRQQSTK